MLRLSVVVHPSCPASGTLSTIRAPNRRDACVTVSALCVFSALVLACAERNSFPVRMRVLSHDRCSLRPRRITSAKFDCARSHDNHAHRASHGRRPRCRTGLFEASALARRPCRTNFRPCGGPGLRSHCRNRRQGGRSTPQTGAPVVFRRRTPRESRLPKNAVGAALYDLIRMLDAPTYPKAFLECGRLRLEFDHARLASPDVVEARVTIRKQER